MQTKVHPIQLAFKATQGGARCDLCQKLSVPRYSTTPPHVTHLVHLVREHLEAVNRTFSPAGRSKEVLRELLLD